MRLAILGSGNVASALVSAFAGCSGEVRVVQVCARNEGRGRSLARQAGVEYVPSPAGLTEAELYILAVSDGAVAELSAQMRVPACAVVAHTAGSVPMDAISSRIRHRGVIYPLQTFTQGRDAGLSAVPVFTEYSTPHAGEVIRRAAACLSDNVREASSELRARLHLAAVFACNFTNHMYALADGLLKESGLGFDVLKPLIEETAAKAVSAASPALAQTGPAARGDFETIRRHLEMLSGDGGRAEELRKEIYEKVSESIWETSKKR